MKARRVARAALNDVRMQWRHGFYAAYALLTVLYILLLRQTPAGPRAVLTPLIVFSDPAFVGFFFIGGILLLERGDRTLQALFITPLRPREYLAAKVLSLGLVSVLTSLAIAAGVAGLDMRPLPLLLGVTLVSSLAILAGIALVSRFQTLNRFVFGGGLAISVFSLPLLGWLGVVHWGWLRLLPTDGAIRLIAGGFGAPPAPGEVLASTGILLGWNVVAWVWATRWFDRHIVGSERGDDG